MKKQNIIIFGATGDLTKRKLIPSIYNLIKNKEANPNIILIGRRNLTKEEIIIESKKFIKTENKNMVNTLLKKTEYLQINFQSKEEYKKLNKIEKEKNIFYLATDPSHFTKIVKNLKENNLINHSTKIVFEKPFGKNLKDSNKINKELKRIIKEKQIYRIDHYLGKDLVNKILYLKFNLLKKILHPKNISKIEISLKEKIGIENRGNYYDKYGAIKDVIQNHALEILALTTIENPKENLRNEKVKILKKVKIKKISVGQYKGYLEEKNIPKDSKTETYAKLEVKIKNKTWKEIPIIIKAGKSLDKKETKIDVKLKDNSIIEINIDPENKVFKIKNNKKENICPFCKNTPNTKEAYEKLFIEIIQGKQENFIRTDELKQLWKIIDKIKKPKLFYYEKGSALK